MAGAIETQVRVCVCVKEFSQTCLADFDNRTLVPNIDTEFAAKNVGKAHLRIENNDTMGKLIGCW